MEQTYVTIGSNEDCLAKWGKEGGGYIGGYDPKTMMCIKTIQAFTCEVILDQNVECIDKCVESRVWLRSERRSITHIDF